MITNIFIGSGLSVGNISTFYTEINSLDSISVTNITLTANEINFNQTFSINTEDDNLIVYNENNSSNIITINYTNNNVEMIKLINTSTIINVTSTTFGFQMIGNPYTNSATQLSFYNDSTLEWLIGPNYTGGRGGGVGLNDFLFFNNNLAYNMIVAQYEQSYVDFNQNLYVYGTFSANTINCINLTISSYSTINELNTNIISAQQVICMPTDQGAGFHIYGDKNYSAELAFLNQNNEKIWEIGATTTDVTSSGNFFFIYNNPLSTDAIGIYTGTTFQIQINADISIQNNLYNSSNVLIEGNLYAPTGTSSSFTQLTILPKGDTEGLIVSGSYLSDTATQIFFNGNTASTETITNFWRLGPIFSNNDNGNFYLWNNNAGVNMIEVDSQGTFINFYGVTGSVFTMSVINNVIVTGNGYIFNIPLPSGTYSNTYTMAVTAPSYSATFTAEYIQIGNYITVNIPEFNTSNIISYFTFTVPKPINSLIGSSTYVIIYYENIYYFAYFTNSTTVYAEKGENSLYAEEVYASYFTYICNTS